MIFNSDLLSNFFIFFKFLYFLENIFLQLFIIYNFIIIFNTNNLYYLLLYFFIIVLFFGIFLCYVQLELFTGFLWTAEFTIIFIALLLLFYLNIDGLIFKYNNKFNTYLYILILSIYIYNYYFNLYFNIELNHLESFNFNIIFDNYYEAFSNVYMNDFSILYISYYSINSLNFVILGLLLLIASIICVNLYKYNKNYSITKQAQLLSIFDFFNIFLNYTFLKKQNLHKQSNLKPTLKIFKNKN